MDPDPTVGRETSSAEVGLCRDVQVPKGYIEMYDALRELRNWQSVRSTKEPWH